MNILKIAKLSLITLSLVTFSACEDVSQPYVESAAIGGISGAAIGAGTGAIIGNASGHAGVGTAIGGGSGAVAGILAGIMIQNYSEKKEISRNNETIADNYQYIVSRQRTIDSEREVLTEDSLNLKPDKRLRSDIYTGPTIGTYNM